MAYFAKKIKYCASPTEFVALIAIASKKRGDPQKFIVYKYNGSNGEAEMIEFESDKKDDAIKAFPYGVVAYFEEDEESPAVLKRRKNLWKKTTDWLYEVGVGGSYKVHSEEDWVKVGRPNRCKNRRKKFRPKFGELGHILFLNEANLETLNERRSFIVIEPLDDPDCIEKNKAEEAEINRLNNEISETERRIVVIKEEMKFKSKKSVTT